MVGLVVVLILVAAVLASLAAARVLRRDSRSVKRYQETLRVLHDVADAGGRVSGNPPDSRPGTAAASHVRIFPSSDVLPSVNRRVRDRVEPPPSVPPVVQPEVDAQPSEPVGETPPAATAGPPLEAEPVLPESAPEPVVWPAPAPPSVDPYPLSGSAPGAGPEPGAPSTNAPPVPDAVPAGWGALPLPDPDPVPDPVSLREPFWVSDPAPTGDPGPVSDTAPIAVFGTAPVADALPVSDPAPAVPVAEDVPASARSATSSTRARLHAPRGPAWRLPRPPLPKASRRGPATRRPGAPAFKPSRRQLGVAAASSVVLVGIVVGLVLSLGGSPHAAPPPAAAPPTPPPATTTIPHHVAPPAPTVVATSSGPYAATYTVSSSQFDLTLLTSNRCWVQLRSGSKTGPVTFSGTLTAGTQHAFRESGGLWIRIGFPPGVTIEVDGHALSLPATGSPFDVSLVVA